MKYVLYQGEYRGGKLVDLKHWIVSEKRLHSVRAKRMRRAARRLNAEQHSFVERYGVGYYQPWGWRVVGDGVDVRWRVRGFYPWLQDQVERSAEEEARLWDEFFAMPEDAVENAP